MKKVKLNKQKLERLNQLIIEYYGSEINVYMIHGLLVSYFSSAASNLSIAELFSGKNAVFKLNDGIKISNEFIKLLSNDLASEVLENTKLYDDIIPLINLDNVRGNIFKYNELNDTEQQNLLDWYIGYFLGYNQLWDHDYIMDFLDSVGDEIINPENDIIVEELFVHALDTQFIVAYELIKKLKPRYKNIAITYSIREIKKHVNLFTKEEMSSGIRIAKNSSCSLLSTILILTQMVGSELSKINVAKNDEIIH